MPRALTPAEKRAKALADRAATGTSTAVQSESVTQQSGEAVQTSARQRTRKRNVFNGTETKLRVSNQIPGYHLHIFNDIAGRIQTALDAGYEFVAPSEVGGVSVNVTDRNTDLGDKVRFLVGRTETGEPMYAYLLKIRQDWYEEDQAALEQRNMLIDEAIRSGKNTKAGTNSDGFYVPREGIKYK